MDQDYNDDRAIGNREMRPGVKGKVDLGRHGAAPMRTRPAGPHQANTIILAGKAAHSSAGAPVPLEPSDLYRARP